MESKFEIERKFLVELPKEELPDVRRNIEILQTYLVSGDDGSQRRVRKITENGDVTYVYTEKVFYSAVTRKETEYRITEEKYHELIADRRPDCEQISKKRICFNYKSQLFELDIYPFSDKLAIMELELETPEQEIRFPEYINIIKEVTGIERYSNSALANAGAFPEEPDCRSAAKGDI